MRRIIARVILLLLLAGIAVAPALAADDGYRISRYSFSGRLTEQNVMEVTEVIEVDFREPSHGIYREIPLTYQVEPAVTGRDWFTYKASVEDLTVKGAPSRTETDGDNLTVRIGSADELVEGSRTYTLSYRYVMSDNRLPDADLLYYSVLGTSWSAGIDLFEFEIGLDKPLDKDALEGVAISSGARGVSGDTLGVAARVEPGRISGSVCDIPANNGVTVFCRLPKGYFSGIRTRMDNVLQGSMVASGALGIVGTLLALLRKKRRFDIGPVDDVPEDLDSAYAGRLATGRADANQILSLIPYWAGQGCLRMAAKETSSMSLTRVKELPQDAPEYQRLLWNVLFGRGNGSTMLAGTSAGLAEGVESAQGLLEKRVRPRGRAWATALLAALCLAVGVLFYLGTTWRYEGQSLIRLIGVPLLLGVFAQQFRLSATRSGKIGWGLGAALFLAVTVRIYGGPLFFDTGAALVPEWILTAAGALSLLFALLNLRLIRLPEDVARDKAKADALKAWLQNTPDEQLARKAQEDPGFVYRLLPFAIAMGMADDWGDYFKAVTLVGAEWYEYDEPNFLTVGMISGRIMRQLIRPYQRSNQKLVARRKAEARKRWRDAMRSGSGSGSDSGGFSSSSGSSGGGGGGGGGGRW